MGDYLSDQRFYAPLQFKLINLDAKMIEAKHRHNQILENWENNYNAGKVLKDKQEMLLENDPDLKNRFNESFSFVEKQRSCKNY